MVDLQTVSKQSIQKFSCILKRGDLLLCLSLNQLEASAARFRHLDASAKVVSRHHLLDVLESGKELLDNLEGLMGKKEYKFVKQSLLSRKIPTPSLLIKDHKKASWTGEFPNRLVVPAQIGIFSNLSNS
jgi:hypothetical protein